MTPARVLDRTSLRQVTEGMVALPTLPLVASRLLEAVKPPQSSATEIGRILSLDPALTARTLRLANSAPGTLPASRHCCCRDPRACLPNR